ncbi:MAG TPA: HlyD family efflux transporter periplasmic adaptor subunit, partial [Gemmataceae bacterium]|nr:HlyD family efflux transporter periplasmic adaptor subunit [Gemmataceae bacterium]
SFEAPELTARRDQARAKLDSAQAALDKANRGPRDEEIAEAKAAAEAAKARYARMITGFREEQKEQAKQELAAALAEEKQAEEELTRLRQASGSGVVSQTDFSIALMVRDRARARVKSARASYDLMMNGNRPEEIAEAQAEADRAEAHYQMLKNGTRLEDKAAAYAALNEAQAALNEAEANLREAAVVAPERCVIETLPVRAGSLVAAGQPVVVAHRTDDLWVKVFVPATELGKLRLGQSVEVSVDSHPGKRFAGQVIQIATTSEFTPRNVQSIDERKHQVFAVKVRVSDPDGVFKSGMAAEVFATLNE